LDIIWEIFWKSPVEGSISGCFLFFAEERLSEFKTKCFFFIVPFAASFSLTVPVRAPEAREQVSSRQKTQGRYE